MFPLFTEPAHSPQTDHWLTDPFYARLKLRARTFFKFLFFSCVCGRTLQYIFNDSGSEQDVPPGTASGK